MGENLVFMWLYQYIHPSRGYIALRGEWSMVFITYWKDCIVYESSRDHILEKKKYFGGGIFEFSILAFIVCWNQTLCMYIASLCKIQRFPPSGFSSTIKSFRAMTLGGLMTNIFFLHSTVDNISPPNSPGWMHNLGIYEQNRNGSYIQKSLKVMYMKCLQGTTRTVIVHILHLSW